MYYPFSKVGSGGMNPRHLELGCGGQLSPETDHGPERTTDQCEVPDPEAEMDDDGRGKVLPSFATPPSPSQKGVPTHHTTATANKMRSVSTPHLRAPYLFVPTRWSSRLVGLAPHMTLVSRDSSWSREKLSVSSVFGLLVQRVELLHVGLALKSKCS